MSELKLCPFCCGEVDNHKDDCYFRLYSVAFVDSLMLGKSGMNVHVSSRELFDAWNTRAERTCENVKGDDCLSFECSQRHGGFSTDPSASASGLDTRSFRYCPHCGARVVVE